MLVEGPNGMYRYSGFNECVVKFSVTSITVSQNGYKRVKFNDGQTITCNHPTDSFYNLTMNTLYNQCHGKVEFKDEENGFYGFYEIGKVKKRRSEYFEGAVFHN